MAKLTDPLEFSFGHASLNTFMSDDKNIEDVKNLLKLHLLYYTFTETGEDRTVHLIKATVNQTSEDYVTINPDAGDICFVIRRDVRLSDYGGPLAISKQPGKASEGGHGPRHNSFFKGRYRGEEISHTGVHFVTRDADHKPGGIDRGDQQIKQARLMAEQMQRFGAGEALAIGSGDINATLPLNREMQKVFDDHFLTTTAEETGNRSPTHGSSRIDYAWTYDKDRRLSVPSMKVLRDQDYNSDHNPIVVKVHVKPRR